MIDFFASRQKFLWTISIILIVMVVKSCNKTENVRKVLYINSYHEGIPVTRNTMSKVRMGPFQSTHGVQHVSL